MTEITDVRARQVLDSRGRPTVEVEIRTAGGAKGRATAVTGQSVGRHEARFLRDEDPSSYRGLSVRKAVENVHDIIGPAIRGLSVADQTAIDEVMVGLDGTERLSRLGGNAIYPTSVACLRAAADSAGLTVHDHLGGGQATTLPVPTFNVINGGGSGDGRHPVNEYLVVPFGFESVADAIECGVVIFDMLGDVIEASIGCRWPTGASAGYAVPDDDPRAVLELLRKSAESAGLADHVAFALDCAASENYCRETDSYGLLGRRVGADEMIDFARELTQEYNLLFIEDLLHEDDWDGFARARSALDRTLLIGDDLIVTDPARIDHAIASRAIDGFMLKPNQVGTISGALRAHERATNAGLLSIPSGRSGGVVDDIVMDLSIALEAPFQKNGAPRTGERVEKLNFLTRVAHEREGARLADLTRWARFAPPRTLSRSGGADGR